MQPPIPKTFWESWRLNKDELRRQGVSVSKYNNEWIVSLWSNPDSIIADTPVINHNNNNKKEVVPSIDLNGLESKLLSYQIPHVKLLIQSMRKYGSAGDASDTGTGKTYAALVVAKFFNYKPVIICPKSVITNWIRACEYVGITDYFCSNYEQYKIGNTNYLKIIKKTKEIYSRKDGEYIEKEVLEKMYWQNIDPANTLLIFDEAHRCKNYRSQNSEMLVQAKKQGYKILLLSATLASNPMHFYSTGFALGLFSDIKEFWNFALSHGCEKNKWGGYMFRGSHKDLLDIYNNLFPEHGSRMRIGDIPEFPETLVIADCYDMNSNAIKIQSIYEEMKKEIDALEEKKQNDIDPVGTLTLLLRERQKIELLKIPTFMELIEDHLESGNSIAVFVNFKQTLSAIAERLSVDYSIIEGGQSIEERQKNIDDFQSDKVRVILCQIQAGGLGISLHDINGKYSRVSLISPTFSAIDLKQALGRIHRAGGKSKSIQKIIFCAGTVEEIVAAKVRSKLNNIDLLNDGDLRDDIFKIKNVK